jgi:hypothetical protein
LIFTQQRKVSDGLDKASLARIKDKVFGYESSLPLPPGKYRLDFLLTDWQKKLGLHAEREVTIPTVDANSLVIPAVLPFSTAETVDPSAADSTPFAMGGVKFTPLSGTPLMMNPGQNLQVAYQIWILPKDSQSTAGQNLQVHYALGQPANIGTSTAVDDTINMGQFDATGSLVNGKKFPLNPQWIGSYMLTIAVSHTGTSEHTSANLSFRAVGGDLIPRPWDVSDPSLVKDANQGVLDQQRGLCYLNLGQVEEARLYFRRSLDRDHANEVARSRLVDAYFSQRDYSAVVSLYNDAGATDETDSETLSHMALSLVKSGDTKRAIALLEQYLHSRPEDGGLYLALAECYEQAGDTKKAAEMTQKGRSYLSAAAQPATP